MDAFNKIKQINNPIPSSFKHHFRIIHTTHPFKTFSSYLILLIYPFNHNLWTLYQPDLYVPLTLTLTYFLINAIDISNNTLFTIKLTKILISHILLTIIIQFITYFLSINLTLINLLILSLHKYIYLFIVSFLSLFIPSYFLISLINIYIYACMFIYLSRAYKLILHGCGINRKTLYFLMAIVLTDILFVILIK